MKATENRFDKISFAALTENEMSKVRGGDIKPKSRDKDVFDFEEE